MIKCNKFNSVIVTTLVCLTIILMLFSFLMYIKGFNNILLYCPFLYVLTWVGLLVAGRNSNNVINYSIAISILSLLCAIGLVLNNPISLILMYFPPMIGYIILSPFETLTIKPLIVLTICLIWIGISITLKRNVKQKKLDV
jgi:hypothetical protein